MTFAEWFAGEKNPFGIYSPIVIEKAWDYQQARIDALEAENRELGLQLITALVPDGYGEIDALKNAAKDVVDNMRGSGGINPKAAEALLNLAALLEGSDG